MQVWIDIPREVPADESPWDLTAAVAKKTALCREFTDVTLAAQLNAEEVLPGDCLRRRMRELLDDGHGGFRPLLDDRAVGFRQCVGEFYYHGGWYKPT